MINKHFQPFNDMVREPEPPVFEAHVNRNKEEHKTIQHLSEEDRPREKLMAKGVEALTNAELFAILIGGGTRKKTAVELMQDILSDCDNRLCNLNRLTLQDLMTYSGIGEAKALSIIAAAEIGRRRMMEKNDDIKQFEDGSVVLEYMRPRIQDLTHENCWVLLLNNAARLIHCARLSEGGLTGAAVDVRVLLKQAIVHDATCFILVHNHPSGNLRPSQDDNRLTASVKKASEAVNIRMIDHVIVSDMDYYSYAENGKI